LSSAILYLAIVAIWAVVLVPRWLRPRATAPQPVPVVSPDADGRASADTSQGAGADLVAGVDRPDVAAGPAGVADEDAGDEAVAEAGPETEIAAPPPAARRAEILKARRRLLTTLITLTVIAAGLAVTRIDAYWIVIPPAVLLTGYLVLLREFAHIDAKRDRRAAPLRSTEASAQAGASPVPAAASATRASDVGSDAPAAPGGAEVIDISGRVGDQVYDQYSDPANRAVGD
jgi:hypothetical protein